MSTRRLIQDVQDFTAFDIIEDANTQLVLEFLQENSQHFDRKNMDGHITGSAWIVNKERTHVLLVHHKASGEWYQPGGHCDGESLVQKVSKREAHEETGVQKLKPLSPLPFDIDVHSIEPRSNKGEGEHLHFDIRYIFEADMNELLTLQEDEVHDAKWFTLDEAAALDNASIPRMVAKTQKLK